MEEKVCRECGFKQERVGRFVPVKGWYLKCECREVADESSVSRETEVGEKIDYEEDMA